MSSRNSERTVYSLGGNIAAVVNEDQSGHKTITRNGVVLPYNDTTISSLARSIAKDGRPLTVEHNGVRSTFKR